MREEYKSFLYKIIMVLLVGVVVYSLFLLKSFIFTLFFAFLLAVLFSPFLNFFNRLYIPDALGVIIIYLIILGFLLLTFFSVLPIFVEQSKVLVEILMEKIVHWQQIYENQGVEGFPLPEFVIEYMGGLLQTIDFSTLFDYLKDNFSSISKFLANNIRNIAFNSFGFFASVAGSIFFMVMVVVFNFFIVLERRSIKNFFYNVLPKGLSSYLQKREKDIVFCFSKWLQGQVILAVSLFVLMFAGLYILSFFGIDVENKVGLSLIVGLMEFVPYIGPILAFLPALAITATMSFKAVLVVFILYLIIQQIEGNVLVPVVMGKTLNLSPFFVLFMMTLGGTLYGILGIILAMPFAAVIQIFVKDYIVYKNSLEVDKG